MRTPTLEDVAVFHERLIDKALKLTNYNEQRSKDLVQLTYLKIGERLIDESKSRLTEITLGYCIRILTNSFLDEQRNKKNKETCYVEELTGYTVPDQDNENENLETFKKFLNMVPFIDREVLLQHQEKTQRQLKKETGVCRPRLRKYKNRGLDKLNEIIKEKKFTVKTPTLQNEKHLSDKEVAQIENEIYNGT